MHFCIPSNFKMSSCSFAHTTHLPGFSLEWWLCRPSDQRWEHGCWCPVRVWSQWLARRPLHSQPKPQSGSTVQVMCSNWKASVGFLRWERPPFYHEYVMIFIGPVQRLLQVKPTISRNFQVFPTFSAQPEIGNVWVCHQKLWVGRWRRKETLFIIVITRHLFFFLEKLISVG